MDLAVLEYKLWSIDKMFKYLFLNEVRPSKQSQNGY